MSANKRLQATRGTRAPASVALERAMSVIVSPADVDVVAASGLLTELDADLLRRYPGEPVNGIEPTESSGCRAVISCWHACTENWLAVAHSDRTANLPLRSSACMSVLPFAEKA